MSETKIEIEELREAGPNGGDLMGYFCRGHVKRYDFAAAANKYTGADPSYDSRYVEANRCRHSWWRTIPMSGVEPGHFEYRSAEPHSRGAFAVTVCESLYENEFKRIAADMQSANKQREYGFTDGLNWALRELKKFNPEASDELLKRYRADRE